MIYPGVQFKSVEGDALFPDANFSQVRPYFGIESVAIHAEIPGRIADSEQSGQNEIRVLHAGCSASGIDQGSMVAGCLPGISFERSQFERSIRSLIQEALERSGRVTTAKRGSDAAEFGARTQETPGYSGNMRECPSDYGVNTAPKGGVFSRD